MKGQETEVKFYVKDLKRVEERLRALGARSIQARVYEVNLRYDLPDSSLRQGGKVLRLRQDERVRLTYKGPSQRSDGVLSRAEFETALDDFESGRNILEALGYIPVATYEKHRSTYELGELHIMLDELPYGDFVEIEGPDAPALQKASKELELDFSAAIPASYLALFEGLCQRRGLDPAQLTFAALEGLQVEPEELSVRPADEG
ncbi:MAG: class IV adenylate cyclase [Anaerolineales bacterium]|nr:class IV adenylate cyclase [Anaerolineales bacterium]